MNRLNQTEPATFSILPFLALFRVSYLIKQMRIRISTVGQNVNDGHLVIFRIARKEEALFWYFCHFPRGETCRATLHFPLMS
jgi:hypothetical protein